MPAKKDAPDIPSTLLRSAQMVQDTYEKTLEAAETKPGPDGGVDASRTKSELMDDARAAGIEGRSKMDKDQLVEALEEHSRRTTAKARG